MTIKDLWVLCCAISCYLALAIPTPGCAPSVPGLDEEIPLLLRPNSNAPSPHRSDLEYDFGPILSSGQTLSHNFILTNPTGQTIHLLRAEIITPCCSAVEALPESIAPGGSAPVRVLLKPGYQSGLKHVVFQITTDDPNRPVIPLTLSATLYASWEVQAVVPLTTTLSLGEHGTQFFRVICRRKGEEGLGLPDRVEAALPLIVGFRGEAVSSERPDGLIQAEREFFVDLPAAREAGNRRGKVVFHWPDDRTERSIVAWEVTPCLRAVPSGFVLGPGTETVEKTIVVSSDGRPFRVLAIAGPLSAETPALSSVAERSHRLRLAFDPLKLAQGGMSDVSITTDHPDQRDVKVSVLVLPADKGAEQ